MPDFIPRKDSLAVAWGANFAQRISDDAARFKISPAVAELLVQQQAEFAQAYWTANSPATRTAVSIDLKKKARAAFVKTAREIAARVRALPGVDRMTLSSLGLVIGRGRSARRSPVKPPTSAPIVSIRSVEGSRISVAFKNVDAPARNGMAPGIHGAQIWFFVGDLPPADIRRWKHICMTTRARRTVRIPGNLPPGTRVWIAAKWTNRRAQLGPMSRPVMTFLGFDLSMNRRAAA